MSKEEEYKKIIRENLNNTLDSGFVPELGKHQSGKVRDIHFTSNMIGAPIIMLASDRISCFDSILGKCIPFKGRILNMINEWAFENTKDIIINASKPSFHPNILVQSYCKNIMIECVVRGYVWGSLAGEYEKGQRDFYGYKLNDGMLRYQKLNEPFFTPTTKAEHDLPMTFSDVEKKLGKELANKVKEISIKLYNRGTELAEKSGLIFIDTKYEFGLDNKGNLFLIDEANTPDSSRYCTIEEYKKFELIKKEFTNGTYENVTDLLNKNPNLKIKELSKQFVRDVLVENGFSYGSTGKIPTISDDDAIEVAYRYIQLYEQLTNKEFVFQTTDVKLDVISSLKKSGLINGGVVVIMAGSDSDMPHIEKIKTELNSFNINSIVRICSAHKQPKVCEEIIKKYNDSVEPIVIIAVAGGTDALSGVASFHSVHPVISCPPKKEEYTSCIYNPPGSSNSLILRPENAARHCAQILGTFVKEARQIMLKKNASKIKTLNNADNNI